MAREVQEINASEDDEESTKQRYRVDGVGGVESLEEDKGGTEGRGGKRNVIEWVHTVGGPRLVTGLGRQSESAYIEVEKEFKALLK